MCWNPTPGNGFPRPDICNKSVAKKRYFMIIVYKIINFLREQIIEILLIRLQSASIAVVRIRLVLKYIPIL